MTNPTESEIRELKAELKRAEFRELEFNVVTKMNAETCRDLEAKLKIADRALEFYAISSVDDDGEIAREAREKIK